MAQTVTNVKIEPMQVWYGVDTAQVVTVTTRPDVSSDLQNDYFFLYHPSASYYVWYNVGGAGVDPAPAGTWTGIMIAISANATAAAVASATQTAVDALANFIATVSGNIVTITNSVVGYASEPHEGVGTGFSFGVSTAGNSEAEVGFCDGEIEVTVEEDLVDVTAHQTGTNVLSQIRTGKTVEAAITLKETTLAQLKKMFVNAGGSFTPVGANGSSVFGWGLGKDFQQTYAQASKLRFHPQVLPSGDKSRDITFHKAYPMLEGITFSGEDILTLPVNFKVYPDTSLNGAVELFVVGDGSQTLT